MRILALFGAGGQGMDILELARTINETTNRWDGYVFVNNGDPADDIEGVKVMGLDEALSLYDGQLEAIIAVGEPRLRLKLANQIKENNIPLASVIWPSIHIPASSSIGAGAVIFPGVFIAVNVTIGENVMISPNAVIGHDVVIDNNVIVASTAVISGMVHLKNNSYVGPNAVIVESMTIGEFSVAALGSVVCRDVEDGDLVIGNPARPSRRSGEKIFKGSVS